MVTTRGRILDQHGQQIAHLDIPVPTPSDGPADNGCCSMTWEGENLLVAVSSREAGALDGYPGKLFVRCRLDARAAVGLSCERASDVVEDITWGYFQPVPET
jgi:hypothetical protein